MNHRTAARLAREQDQRRIRRIARLKKRIEGGSYKVPTATLVQALLLAR